MKICSLQFFPIFCMNLNVLFFINSFIYDLFNIFTFYKHILKFNNSYDIVSMTVRIIIPTHKLKSKFRFKSQKVLPAESAFEFEPATANNFGILEVVNSTHLYWIYVFTNETLIDEFTLIRVSHRNLDCFLQAFLILEVLFDSGPQPGIWACVFGAFKASWSSKQQQHHWQRVSHKNINKFQVPKSTGPLQLKMHSFDSTLDWIFADGTLFCQKHQKSFCTITLAFECKQLGHQRLESEWKFGKQ